MYIHEEMKTMSVPGRTRKFHGVENRTGETERRIPVATAVARHLMTASASAVHSAGAEAGMILETHTCTQL
jgi:hypothetical protein